MRYPNLQYLRQLTIGQLLFDLFLDIAFALILVVPIRDPNLHFWMRATGVGLLLGLVLIFVIEVKELRRRFF